MQFSRLSQYFSRIEATPKRLEITAILAELLKESSPEEIDKICYLVLGQLAPLYEGVEFNLAGKMLLRVMADAYMIPGAAVEKIAKDRGDLGDAAEELSQKSKTKDQKLSVGEVYRKLREIAEDSGTGSSARKVREMALLFQSLDSLSVRYVARIPVASLRLGFSDKTILDALSVAEVGDKSLRPVLERAYNVSADIGRIARLAKSKGVKGLEKIGVTVGVPVRMAAAERLPDPKAILEKMGGKLAAEPKYDGFRCISGYTPLYVERTGICVARDVRVGDRVLTHRGRFRRVVAKKRRTIKKGEAVFRFQTFLGNEFKITGDHPVLCFRDGREVWLPVEELTTKDWVVFPVPIFGSGKRTPSSLELINSEGYAKTIPMDRNFYRFLGFWIGDGFTNNYHSSERIGLTFNDHKERELADFYTEIIKKTFGITKTSVFVRGGGRNIYWRDKPFREWLTKHFRREWQGKMIPPWFLNIPQWAFEEFAKGWLESDGTERHSGGYKITTKERDLVMYGQLLFLKNGKPAGIRRERVSGKTYYHLIIPGTEKNARLKDGRLLVKALKVEKMARVDPRFRVYDFQVEEDKSFCVTTVAVHNCQIHLDKSRQFQKADHDQLALIGGEELRGPWVGIFSRNLESTTAMFPEIATAAQKLPAKSLIFEGEAIAYNPETEEFEPFQETAKRKRKYGIKEKAVELPLKVFAFDLLYLDGRDLTREPYETRRRMLEKLMAKVPDTILVAEERVFTDAKELEKFFLEEIEHGLEGIMTKRLDGVYQAGVRNFNWVKLKRVEEGKLEDTVDCVVLGYYTGRGKRTKFGIGGFLVAVYDDKTDTFKTISRVGSGLTDEEWREMKKRVDALKTKEKPKNAEVEKALSPDVWAKPAIVVAIRADEITRSPMHTAAKKDGEPGLALRFPRLMAFRDDKSPEQATTVAEMEELFRQQRKR
jgi:ATP-dependent DNA ligase